MKLFFNFTQQLITTIDVTTTPVTPRLTHDTGPLFLEASSFFDLDPRLSGRGNFEPGLEPPPPVTNLIGAEVDRPVRVELILGNFERQRNIVPLISLLFLNGHEKFFALGNLEKLTSRN